MTPGEEEVLDSPKGWVARHVRRYVETDGKSGHRWSGVNTLLLTARGRKTRKLRREIPVVVIERKGKGACRA